MSNKSRVREKLKEESRDLQVSGDASITFLKKLDEFSNDMVEKMCKLVKEDKRKTIQSRDVEEAFRIGVENDEEEED